MSDEIIRYYTDDYVEADRLRGSAGGRLEFLRSQELLRRHLPATGAKVADIGGGTGAHAAWLVADGHEVVLLDLVTAHVAMAMAAIPGLNASVTDARSLPLDDKSVDATLLLGPLYHLQESSDRRLAVAEAVRITRPGGLVAAAAISRYAAIIDLAVQGLLTPARLTRVREQLATGRHDPRVGFTDAYMHSCQELADELNAAGLSDVVVHGVEGPLWPATRLLPVEGDIDQYLLVARELETDASVVALSGHLMAIARVRSDT